MSAATEAGITVEDLVVGNGESFTTGRLLYLHYTLTLGGFEENNGRLVDSSRARNRPFS